MGAGGVAAGLPVVGHDDRLDRADREVGQWPARFRRALLEAGPDDLVVVRRREEHRQPAVRHLARQRDAGRGERRQVDRDLVADRVGDELQPHVEVEDLALVPDALPLQDHADDLDRLPHPAHAALELDAVPALDDLVAGGAQSEDEAAV